MPRRSRRIARLPPEVNQHAASMVCRQLGFADDQQCVSEAAREKYVRFFDKPLSRDHVVALASLLGKEVPHDTHDTQEQLVEVVAAV